MTTPMVPDGPMTVAWFLAYVEQALVPTLRRGDIVILDNLPAHKGRRDHGQPVQPQRAAGARADRGGGGASLLYLPPYPPDLKPIENAFAKLKPLLRKAAERTAKALWTAIGRPDGFTPVECANYFATAGYDVV